MRRMKSREDETYVALTNGCYGDTKRELYEIAMSLGRIADMLAEMNGFPVDYDDLHKEKKNVVYAHKKDSIAECIQKIHERKEE